MGYTNKELKENIDNLKTRRKSLVDEIKNLDKELLILEKTYSKNEIKYFFDKGMCSSCKEKLSIDDIKYEIVYCDCCRDADSVLDWNSHLT